MLDSQGHQIRAGQIRVAFEIVHPGAALICVLRAPDILRRVGVVEQMDKQHHNWSAEALADTWLIGAEMQSVPRHDPWWAATLHELPGVVSLRPHVFCSEWQRDINAVAENVRIVRQIAQLARQYVPTVHREPRAARDPVWDDRTPAPAKPTDPLADPIKRARYYGTRNPMDVETRPTHRQCDACSGTGGDSVGAQCGACRGAGVVPR